MASFALDPLHSQVEFVARHMVFSKVRGSFSKFSVDLEIDESTKLPTSIYAEIDAKSINTNVEDRDAHLRSEDFLHADVHTTLTFRSTKVTGTADDFAIAGDLTIRGVTKPVTLKATFDGSGKDPWGNERFGYTATTTINRKDFGLTWSQTLETGGLLVGDNIEIILTIEAVKTATPAAV